MRNPLVSEIALIVFVSFWSSLLAGVLVGLAFGSGLTVTYMLAVLTVGPVLAIYRGIKREQDALSLTERAMAELLSLIILLGLGSLIGRFLG